MWSVEFFKPNYHGFPSRKMNPSFFPVKIKVFEKKYYYDFRLVHILTTGKAEFSKYMRPQNHLIAAAETFEGKKNLCPVLLPTKSRDMGEQIKLAHKVDDVAHRTIR